MTDDIHPAVRAAFAPIRDAFEEACRQARQEWPWVEAVGRSLRSGETFVVETEIVGQTVGDMWDGYVWNGKGWVDAADFSWSSPPDVIRDYLGEQQ